MGNWSRWAVVGALMATLPTGLAANAAVSQGQPVGQCHVPGDPLTGSGAVARTSLTRAELLTDDDGALVDNNAFALPANAAPPSHQFSGALTLRDTATRGQFTTLKDPDGYALRPGIKHLPALSIQFVQDCSYLIPVARGLQYTGDPNWNVIVSPGRTWNEAGDAGWTRASFPFTLVERNANCTHNGLMEFLFDDGTVSEVRYQIVKETCEYFQFDMWGQLPASYQPQAISGANHIIRGFASEVRYRVPTEPITALAADYPSAGIDTSVFGSGITPSAMTTYGLYYRGVDYVAGCATRDGDYPYCGEMILPSYSLAKTLFPGVAMMRLTRLYGSAARLALVKDYLPEPMLAAGDWSAVTFQNASDMATGNYDSSSYEADEDGAVMTAFLGVEPYALKMRLALSFPHQAPPGTTWVYHTSDSFLLAQAENNFFDARAAATHKDLWDYLVRSVYSPLHVSPDSWITERTDNRATGVPLGGLGLFLTQDAVAKIASLLNNTAGRIGGQQVLDPGTLADAMQRDPASRGLPTSPPSTDGLYHDNMWAAKFSGNDCSFYVPYLSGYGGITIAMMPNGATYYYFSDNGEFSWRQAVDEAGKLAANC